MNSSTEIFSRTLTTVPLRYSSPTRPEFNSLALLQQGPHRPPVAGDHVRDRVAVGGQRPGRLQKLVERQASQGARGVLPEPDGLGR